MALSPPTSKHDLQTAVRNAGCRGRSRGAQDSGGGPGAANAGQPIGAFTGVYANRVRQHAVAWNPPGHRGPAPARVAEQLRVRRSDA